MRATGVGAIVMAVVVASCSPGGGPASPPGPQAGPFDWRDCSLENVLINTSHLVEVAFDGEAESVEFFDPADTGFSFGRSARDRAASFFFDVIDTTVIDVQHVRTTDPRAADFGELAPGVELTIAHATNGLGGELIPVDVELLTVAVGQYERGTQREWLVHAAFDIGPDGTVRFDGDCGSELDRQFDAVSAELVVGAGASEIDQLIELVDRALEPGRAGDMRYFERPPETRLFVGTDGYVIPAALDGEVRRITWQMRATSPTAQQAGFQVGLRSSIGVAGSAGVQVGAATVESIAAVDGPIEFWMLGLGGEPVTLLATLPADQAGGADALSVEVDLAAGTATISVEAEVDNAGDVRPITVDLGVPSVALAN